MCVLELFYKSSWTFGKLFLNFSDIVLELLYIGDMWLWDIFMTAPKRNFGERWLIEGDDC